MTGINIIAPISIRRPGLPRLGFPKLGIGAAIAAACNAIMQATELAYVAPYRAIRQQPADSFQAGPDGRDPNW